MFKKRALTIVLMFFAVVFVLFGCSSSDEAGTNGNTDDSSSGDTKTVKFMHLWPEGSSQTHYNIVKIL